MRPRIRLIVGAGIAAACVSGCGGGSSSTAADHASTSVPPPAQTVTKTVTTASSPTTTGSGTTTTAASNPPCTASDLGLTFLGSNGATGNVVLYLELRNSGTVPCHTYGYPGVEFLAADGSGINTVTTRTIHDILGNTPETAIELAPNERSTFRMVVAVNGPESICTNATGLQVIAPNDTQTMRVAFPNPILQCGKTTVSPLEPGLGAVPSGT